MHANVPAMPEAYTEFNKVLLVEPLTRTAVPTDTAVPLEYEKRPAALVAYALPREVDVVAPATLIS